MTEFYDSARWGLIPAGADALLYGDGRYAATAADAKRFKAVRWITVLGSPECGAADYEQGNRVFDAGVLRTWAEARKAMGCRARVYTDLANLALAHSLIGDLPNVCWWISTLDNVQRTAGEVLELARARGVTLAPDTLWAQQWKGGPDAPYDESVLLGTW
jgi:hypothetical protein